MSESVCLLGRQPVLGLAELESLYGTSAVQPFGAGAAVVALEPADIAFSRLGGSLKLGRVLATLPGTDLRQSLQYLAGSLPELITDLPEGKVRLGLSVYGLRASVRELNRAGLDLKKQLKSTGRSLRIVPNTSLELNAAQVWHNQLTGPTGVEILLISDGKRTLVAQTTAVQDITAYAARDQARPKRDARVGMLPPKLAQIIINLAASADLPTDATVLDPFCGTGVVLQEALLMGYQAYGTDLEPRMVEYSQTNLDWLRVRHPELASVRLSTGDATNVPWQAPFNLIACETYLGRPFSQEPRPEILSEVMQDVDTIHRKFLQNLARQTPPGFRLCLAIPAWKTKTGFKHLKSLASLEDLGYTRVSFVHARSDQLLYYRPDQFVARQLIVLIRK